MASHYDWLADWVENHVLLTLVAAKGPDVANLLAAFGATDFDLGERTVQDLLGLNLAAVQIGTTAEGWVHSVEISSVVGGSPAFIERLTVDGGEAVSLCFTATVSALSYAKDGEHINGFDIDLPTFRYGSDQHSFDPQMEKAGLLAQDGPVASTKVVCDGPGEQRALNVEAATA